MNNEEIASNKIYGFTTEDLKKWAIEYDTDYGQWKESEYEGLSFYNYVMEKLEGEDVWKEIEEKEWSKYVYPNQ